MIASIAVEEALLLLKIAFLVLLYLFIWRIVRSAARDLRLPQESMILAPQQAAGLVPQPTARETGRLVVVSSSALEPGAEFELNGTQLTVGRGANNDIALTGDEFSSDRPRVTGDESSSRSVPGSSAGLASTTSRPVWVRPRPAAAACCGASTKLSCGRRRSFATERTIRQMKR